MQKSVKKDDASGAKSEFWGICCESGKRYSQIVYKKYHISMAALDPTDTMTSPCVSLMLERDGCQYLLCSLKPDSVLQVSLNLYFDKGENITFFLKGHGTVHLSGYYICDETDASNTDSAKKGGINTLSKKVGKKPQTSFTVSEDIELESSDDDEEESSEVEESSAVKGKGISPIKKVVPSAVASKKNQNLKAISKKENTSEDETSDEDDSEDEDTGKDGELLKLYATKRVHSTVESAEESSSDEEDSSDSDIKKAGIIKQQHPNKKFKTDTSTPAQNNKATPKTLNKSAVVVLDPHTGKPDMNSSIGRTPMPKKPVSSIVQKTSQLELDAVIAKMKNQKKHFKKDSSDSEEEVETSAIKTPEKKSLVNDKLDTPAQSESAKKKKKKKKSKATANESTEATPNKSPAKPQFSHKLPSGVEYEDIRIGNGLPAKKGKLVHVYYTGKLENNKVFDSCQQGSKPFSFKLATGQVIKGWDLGIEGMKVGGKRKLKIPPNMGYGNERMEDIPKNSTLYFVVELKAVS